MKELKKNYVICIRSEDSADIELRKVYEVLPDELAAKRGHLRVIDESGEDYLYPKECFVPVHLPEAAVRAMTTILPPPTRAHTSLPPAHKARRS